MELRRPHRFGIAVNGTLNRGASSTNPAAAYDALCATVHDAGPNAGSIKGEFPRWSFHEVAPVLLAAFLSPRPWSQRQAAGLTAKAPSVRPRRSMRRFNLPFIHFWTSCHQPPGGGRFRGDTHGAVGWYRLELEDDVRVGPTSLACIPRPSHQTKSKASPGRSPGRAALTELPSPPQHRGDDAG